MPTTRAIVPWLLVVLVIVGAVGVMLGILAEGTNTRRRSRESIYWGWESA